jgi:hypothetical protein
VNEKNQLTTENSPLQKAVIFCSLGSFNPNTIGFWSYLENLYGPVLKEISPDIVEMVNQPNLSELFIKTIKELLHDGEVILILDGLDEFERIYGEGFRST